MIEVTRADSLGPAARHVVATLLASAFADDFASISTSTDRLARAFEHIVIPERFYVASVEGHPAGIATLTEGKQEVFAPRWAPFRNSLGAIRGTIGHLVVRGAFMGADPGAEPGRAEIGFVGTMAEHQGKGVATALLTEMMASSGHHTFVLRDIKDTNAPALGLYRKLGFVEHSRRAVRFARRAGFGAYVTVIRVCR
ncbi:GNAT family N-acetyltransferase [Ruania halotolerans]|uniref:GNAT family N-acetyltransferase n=1 Tax=Ruania halotolerans TaxID=2897773 RepID=UPI001E3333B1|nr:GNAT family N-acetyltransferase [Ruania halotolerans]UFU05408.1 GNAT family N-acetyltransferase [Ruania halotolerans]